MQNTLAALKPHSSLEPLPRSGVRREIEKRLAGWRKLSTGDRAELIAVLRAWAQNCEGRAGFMEENPNLRDIAAKPCREAVRWWTLEPPVEEESELWLTSFGEVFPNQRVTGQLRRLSTNWENLTADECSQLVAVLRRWAAAFERRAARIEEAGPRLQWRAPVT